MYVDGWDKQKRYLYDDSYKLFTCLVGAKTVDK